MSAEQLPALTWEGHLQLFPICPLDPGAGWLSQCSPQDTHPPQTLPPAARAGGSASLCPASSGWVCWARGVPNVAPQALVLGNAPTPTRTCSTPSPRLGHRGAGGKGPTWGYPLEPRMRQYLSDPHPEDGEQRQLGRQTVREGQASLTPSTGRAQDAQLAGATSPSLWLEPLLS